MKYTLSSIEQVVCGFFNVEPKVLHDKSRKREIVEIRQFCMYFMSISKAGSLKEIADYFGGYDHTSVLYSVNEVKRQAEVDVEVKGKLRELSDRIVSKHSMLIPNKTLTKEERREIMDKAIEDATTILVNAMTYCWVDKPVWANVTGPDGLIYKIQIERHG